MGETYSEISADRFWARADKSGGADACWVWLGVKNAKGYGRFSRGYMAHRVAHALNGGTIPDGYSIDHLCRNRACVNPRYLEAVPHRINLLRGNTVTARAAAATHCPSGHPYDAANTVHRKRGSRECKACIRRRNYESYVPRANARRRRPHLTESELATARGMIVAGKTNAEVARAIDISEGSASRLRARYLAARADR